MSNLIVQLVTKNGRTALWYAASEGHNNVLYYLLREKHNSYSLLEDRRVSLRSELVKLLVNHIINVVYTNTAIPRVWNCMLENICYWSDDSNFMIIYWGYWTFVMWSQYNLFQIPSIQK